MRNTGVLTFATVAIVSHAREAAQTLDAGLLHDDELAVAVLGAVELPQCLEELSTTVDSSVATQLALHVPLDPSDHSFGGHPLDVGSLLCDEGELSSVQEQRTLTNFETELVHGVLVGESWGEGEGVPGAASNRPDSTPGGVKGIVRKGPSAE